MSRQSRPRSHSSASSASGTTSLAFPSRNSLTSRVDKRSKGRFARRSTKVAPDMPFERTRYGRPTLAAPGPGCSSHFLGQWRLASVRRVA